jgi:hypothetical protein
VKRDSLSVCSKCRRTALDCGCSEPRGYWKKLLITDPRVPAAREALRAVWRKGPMAVAGATPRVNQLQVSKDGTRCRGNVIVAATRGRTRQGLGGTTTPVEADLPGGPAPARLMDRFKTGRTP